MLNNPNLKSKYSKRKILIIGLAIISTIILTGFFISPLESMTIDRTGTLCKLRGGNFIKNYYRNIQYFCNQKYKDGGTTCTDSEQCEGNCNPTQICLDECPSIGYFKKEECSCDSGTCEYAKPSPCSLQFELKNKIIKTKPLKLCD